MTYANRNLRFLLFALFSKIKSTKLPFKTSYHLTLLSQEIDKHVNYYQEEFRKLLFEYGMQDENGNLIPTPDGQGVLLIEEKTEEAYGKIYHSILNGDKTEAIL